MEPQIEPANLVEIFFSYRLAECEQHILTLSAVGIHSWTKVRDGGFAVLVSEDSLAAAQKNLREVAEETLAAQAQPPAPLAVSHPNAWMGSVLYAMVLMTVAYAAGIDSFGVDWLELGSINGSVPSTHQWWRVFTALTLHSDVAHLTGNLVFGIVLGYVGSIAVGGGIAWTGIVLGAALGNTLDVLLMPASHSSIGASTAVFAALGLISAHAWRQGNATGLRRVKQWAPLVAGVMLLALTGMGGENTDVVAHVTGFICGGLFGVILGRMNQERFQKRSVQITAATLTVAAIAFAWAWALLRGHSVS
jgi:membrane associated rhomboid family serine protease